MHTKGTLPEFVGENVFLEENEFEVTSALDWVRNLEPTSPYGHNLKVLAQADYLRDKDAGYVASMVMAYRKSLEASNNKASEWVGTVKKCEIFKGLKLVHVVVVEGFYGFKWGHKFVDGEGNIFMWRTSSYDLSDLLNETFDVKATVKEHTEYKGMKQTVLTRCSSEDF